MKKYIKVLIISTLVLGAASFLLRSVPKGQLIYVLLNAAVIGYINFKAYDEVVKIGEKCHYPEMEELKASMFNKGFGLDKATTPRVLYEAASDMVKLRKLNTAVVIVVIVLAAVVLTPQ